MKNLDLVMYIYKTSGVATLLDIRRTSRYHHREVSGHFLMHIKLSISKSVHQVNFLDENFVTQFCVCKEPHSFPYFSKPVRALKNYHHIK